MKFDSPLFDRIRVKSEEDRRPRADAACCEWPDCAGVATHRAPKGRSKEREYWRFCLEHVRAYNQSYNYFAGMSDDAVARYQKDALTGHLPTWKIGMVGGGRGGPRPSRSDSIVSDDPFDVMREFGGAAAAQARAKADAERRSLRNAERKALHALNLEEGADRAEIRARFKELVKRHHPDVNGGDRAFEQKLREIIEAYNYLKKSGLC